MKNLHVLKVKYLPSTNTQPSRIKISSKRFKQYFIFTVSDAWTNYEKEAIEALRSRGFHIVGYADGYVISDTFKALK